VDVHPIRFAYDIHGNSAGRPIVFLHAFPFHRGMWAPQVQAFSSQYRLYTYDHRGQGESHADDGPFTLEFLVDDLFALLDHWELPRATLCGLSMGGYVALRAMERDPGRISGLVLCDTRSEADSNEAKLKRYSSLKLLRDKGLSAFADENVKALLDPATTAERPEVARIAREIAHQNSVAGLSATLLALASRTDTTASLFNISVPTLILVGESDRVTPPEAARAMADKIPHAELHVIPKAGHLSNFENSSVFNEHLGAFLKR